MKKLTLSLLFVIVCLQFSHSQTNTFPSSGNVGIGTTSPIGVLDVIGGWGAFSSTAHVTSSFAQDHTNQRGLYFGYDASGQIGVIAGNTTGAASNIAFWNYTGSAWFEAMRLTSAGNLGIGTTSPDGALSLGSSVINRKLLIYDDGNGASGFGQGNSEFRIFGISSGTNHISFGKYTLSSDLFAEQMRITNSGNVGIGTTTPLNILDVNGGLAVGTYAGTNTAPANGLIVSGNTGIGTTTIPSGYLLAVNGNAIATSVTVQAYSSWPDYVFKPKYHLPSLTDIKTYIDLNHHLPEIPSEKEVKKDGLNLGEMNKLLVKKVEELTLYLIEKDKEIKEEQTKNTALENKLNAQQGEITQMKQQLEVILKQLTK